jgi:Ca2+-binding RTX toxin-like protein
MVNQKLTTFCRPLFMEINMTTVTIIGTFAHDIIDTNLLNDPAATSYRVEASHGDDRITTGWTADFIFGGKGDDYIYAGDGDDYVSAGNHNDFVSGGRGNDYLLGGAGDDVVHGGKGNDYIDGGSGNDMLYGIKGANEIYGGEGDDLLNSGRQRSTLDGGAGEDRIQADMLKGGDHVLTGGADADTFEFLGAASSKTSILTITDFVLGEDTFAIDGTTVEQFFDDYLSGALTPAADLFTDTATGLTIRLDGGDELRFNGLNEADFVDHYIGGFV